jgi:hypothetical protein
VSVCVGGGVQSGEHCSGFVQQNCCAVLVTYMLHISALERNAVTDLRVLSDSFTYVSNLFIHCGHWPLNGPDPFTWKGNDECITRHVVPCHLSISFHEKTCHLLPVCSHPVTNRN